MRSVYVPSPLRNRVLEGLAVIVAVCVVVRVIAEIVAPLIPALVILLVVVGIYRFVLGGPRFRR